ncbi:MAG: hypothetical protein QW655_04055 [Nitrososphaerota archaeon]
MILETHGETCRLGYLKLLPCIMEDEEPRSFDFLSNILYELVSNLNGDYQNKNLVGLITRNVNARNYVTLGAEIGLIDRKTQKIGVYGKVYLTMNSSSMFRNFVQGLGNISLKDLITLNDAEKLFFLWVISIADYPFIQLIISWAVEKEKFTRQEAMNYIMEEAYPSALKKILQTLPEKKRRHMEEEIAEAEKFRENRLAVKNKSEWIRSSQYAKYRHIAPPRLEWLVDIGILKRNGRGKYSTDDQLVRNIEKLIKLPKMNIHKVEEAVFEDISKILFSSYRSAGRYEISKTIIEAYNKLENSNIRPIRLDFLEKIVSLLLLEKKAYATLSTIHDVFNSLAIRFPDKIYVSPAQGGSINVAKIDVTATEI